MRPFVAIGALAIFGSSASGQDVIRQWYGSASLDYLPRAIAIGGDVDGDGVPDVAISSGWVPPYSPPPHVQLLSGRTGSVLFDLLDPFAGYEFGAGLAFLGDVDGDGFSEFAIGSMAFDDAGSRNGKGYVKVYSGSDASELWTIAGEKVNDWLGAPIATGDFDNDGTNDLLISALGAEAPGKPKNAGGVFVISGATHSEIRRHYGIGADDLFGNALAVGDFNGDGNVDYAVSAMEAGSKSEGAVYLFDGSSGASLYSLAGSQHQEWFGHDVSTIGDVNGDFCDDFLVGAPYYDTTLINSEGRALVYSGIDGALIRSHVGPSYGSWEGWEVEGIGDCDADGSPDYALGRPTSGAGAVLLFSGVSGSLLKQIDGTTAGEYFGYFLGGGADFDQDGYSDVVAAAPLSSTYHFESGRVDVLTIAEHPRPTSVDPSRLRYSGAPSNAVTITGRHFQIRPITSVDFDGAAATNVTVVDDSTLTCDAPDGAPGPAAISISSVLGTGRLTDVFRRTPSTRVEGDFARAGAVVVVTYEFDVFDSVFTIVGVGPSVSMPIHGYDGALCISPFLVLFTALRWPSDEFQLAGTIPSDPGLLGIEVLLQGLVGPNLTGHSKDAAWTNCASFVIR